MAKTVLSTRSTIVEIARMLRKLIEAGDSALIAGTPMIPLHKDTVQTLSDAFIHDGCGCGCHWTFKGIKDLDGTLTRECAYHMDIRKERDRSLDQPVSGPAKMRAYGSLSHYTEIRNALMVVSGPLRTIDEELALAMGWSLFVQSGASPRYWLVPGSSARPLKNAADRLHDGVYLAYPPAFTGSVDAANALLDPLLRDGTLDTISMTTGSHERPAHVILKTTDGNDIEVRAATEPLAKTYAYVAYMIAKLSAKEPPADKAKPHHGRIKNWRREDLPEGGFRICGYFLDHPFIRGDGHTSRVIVHAVATGEVETRNSRYTLVSDGEESRVPGFAKKGDSVRFLGKNGYEHDVVDALKAGLVIGQIYEVTEVNIGWSSSYALAGKPCTHNTVMFELVDDKPGTSAGSTV